MGSTAKIIGGIAATGKPEMHRTCQTQSQTVQYQTRLVTGNLGMMLTKPAMVGCRLPTALPSVTIKSNPAKLNAGKNPSGKNGLESQTRNC